MASVSYVLAFDGASFCCWVANPELGGRILRPIKTEYQLEVYLVRGIYVRLIVTLSLSHLFHLFQSLLQYVYLWACYSCRILQLFCDVLFLIGVNMLKLRMQKNYNEFIRLSMHKYERPISQTHSVAGHMTFLKRYSLGLVLDGEIKIWWMQTWMRSIG